MVWLPCAASDLAMDADFCKSQPTWAVDSRPLESLWSVSTLIWGRVLVFCPFLRLILRVFVGRSALRRRCIWVMDQPKWGKQQKRAGLEKQVNVTQALIKTSPSYDNINRVHINWSLILTEEDGGVISLWEYFVLICLCSIITPFPAQEGVCTGKNSSLGWTALSHITWSSDSIEGRKNIHKRGSSQLLYINGSSELLCVVWFYLFIFFKSSCSCLPPRWARRLPDISQDGVQRREHRVLDGLRGVQENQEFSQAGVKGKQDL